MDYCLMRLFLLDNFNTSDSNYCKKSRFVLNENSTQAEVAQTSIGQGETLVTPAHMGYAWQHALQTRVFL